MEYIKISVINLMFTDRKQITGCLRPRVQVIAPTGKEYKRTLHDREVLWFDCGGGYIRIYICQHHNSLKIDTFYPMQIRM